MIYLDTHVVVWLYLGRLDAIPLSLVSVLEREDLYVSPMVVLELEYLAEIGRVREHATHVQAELKRTIGLEVCDLPFPEVTHRALGETWTRDPFDRLIVAQARLRDAQLVTKDELIHEHYDQAVWQE